jgi:hypothetical protein
VVNLGLLGHSVFFASDSQAEKADKLYLSLVLSFFSISLVENAVATGLIISKILTVYCRIQGYVNGLGHRIVPILYILIESGLITFAAQLAHLLMFKFANWAFPIIDGLVIQLYVRFFFYIYLSTVVFDYISIRIYRDFRQQSFLCVSRWALLTMPIIAWVPVVKQ